MGVDWTRAADIAARQHGRIAIAQLRDAGIGRGSVEKGLRSGRLHRVFDGVFALGHRAPSLGADRMAAVLRCGPEAALGFRAAAGLHGLGNGDVWPVDVISPTGRGRGVRGIRVHRSPLPEGHRARVDGIPVTSVARTLADLAHAVSERELRAMIREAQYRRVFDLDAAIEANGRRRSALLSVILEDLAPTESPLEDLFRANVVKRFRLPEPDYQPRLPGARPDARWARARLIVELDGAHHANPLTHQTDIARDNALHLSGELVLRYAAPDLTRHPRRTATQIARALRDRGGYDISWV
jgi:very-short-patch-repair endonuclease